MLTSDKGFFAEKDEFLALLRAVASGSDGGPGDETADAQVKSAAAIVSAAHTGNPPGSQSWAPIQHGSAPSPSRPLSVVGVVYWGPLTRVPAAQLDRYQEQPTLLDSALPESVDILMGAAREAARAAANASEPSGESDSGGAFPFQMYLSPRLHRVFQLVYLLCKTRGYKHVVRLLPHEVADLEPVVSLLLSQDPTQHDTWETRYGLLLWLSMLVRVPFDLNTADSTLAGDAGEDNAADSRRGLVSSVISTCQQYLSDPGAVRDAAAVCLSRLLTRPDMDSDHLRRFLTWADGILESSLRADHNHFQCTGVFTAIVHVAKSGHREVLRETLPIIFGRVVELSAAGTMSSPLLRKMIVKLAQRTGLTYLPPRVVSWRYKRGQRSLLDNLSGAGVAAAQAAQATAAAQAAASPAEEEAEEDDDDIEVPTEIEDIVEMLLTGLRDRDTVVRWSAAKGIGRVTGRLPRDFAGDVVGAVLQLLCEEEGDGAWHGGCLALAELARRGLLLPSLLPEVVPVVVRALAYDVRRGAHSVGTHVRDAACYVCWAFARAYSPSVMRPYVGGLARAMMTVAVFDREVNCRRAASAAFQENVGRQGHENFPNGIEILTAADYFTLGNRTHAYLEVAPFAGRFPHYRYAFIDHLVVVKLRHWDVSIRELAARSLARMVPLDPRHFADSVLDKLLSLSLDPELLTRHGACLAAAEVVLALAKVPYNFFRAATLSKTRNLVPRIEKARLYRGRGGEYMRRAVCRFVECLTNSAIGVSRRLGLRLLKTLDECLRHPKPEIQNQALAALRVLSANVLSNGADKDVVAKMPIAFATVLRENDNPAARRGMALGLGCLPKSVLCRAEDPRRLRDALDTLIGATKVERVVARRDAETRRNAALAIAELCETVGMESDGTPGLSPSDTARVVDALLACTKDYSTDQRGDVGSWVRMAAARALERVARVLLASEGTSGGRNTGSGATDSQTWTPGRVLSTPYGNGVLAALRSEGEVCEIKFSPPALGAWFFPYGPASIARSKVEGWQRDTGASSEVRAAESAEFEVSAAPGREQFLVADAEAKVAGAIEAGEGVAGHPPAAFSAPRCFWSTEMSRNTVAALLRLAAEKLDLTRGVAGGVLTRLIHDDSVQLPGVPHRAELLRLIPPLAVGAGTGLTDDAVAAEEGVDDGPSEDGDAGGAAEEKADAPERKHEERDAGNEGVLNWSVPGQCFPVLVRTLGLGEYTSDVVEGLVTSVGGLSESVVKESSIALKEWGVAAARASSYRTLSRAALALLGLLGWDMETAKAAARARASKDAAAAAGGEAKTEGKTEAAAAVSAGTSKRPKIQTRLVSPVLRTLDLLLANGVFDALQEPRSPFASECVNVVRLRVMRSDDAVRVMAAIPVFLGLVPFGPDVREPALRSLLDLLVHPFPKVRKLTASSLYERLLTHEELFDEEKLDDALVLLTETPWDGDVELAFGPREELHGLLGVPLQADRPRVGPTKRGGAASSTGDEHQHYSSLVNEMGY